MDFEIKLIEFLQSGRSPFFDMAFQVVSIVGSVLGVIAVFGLFLIFRKKICLWYIFTYGFVFLAISITKNCVERVRPFNVSDTISNIGDVVTGWSFPSGHMACATTIAIFVGYFLFQYFTKTSTRIGIVVSCVLYAGLVGLSRMYLGKHFLTDIIGGFAIASVICVAGLCLMHFVHKKKRVKNEN